VNASLNGRFVRYESDAGVVTITMDSPRNRNALSRSLLLELAERLTWAEQDDAVRAIVLTGAGSVFSSGADLSDPPRPNDDRINGLPAIMTSIMKMRKVVIVRVNGHVRAGGFGLVAAADIVVASNEATFAFSEVRIGVVPAVISVVCSRRMDSRSMARYMLLGETFDSNAAARAGLVTSVVDHEKLDSTVEELCATLRQCEPHAVGGMKRLLTELSGMSIEEGLLYAEKISLLYFNSPEAKAGILAYREKRPMPWTNSSQTP
jgi:methylglutaconyl-CoA hydratase